MSTLTPNYGLIVPDGSDTVEQVRADYATNLNTIDGIGGGGSGGHTIIDQSGNAMPSRTGLQFIGASVTDDSVNNKTVVTVTGGGGGVHYSTSEQVIGTWIDGKPLYEKTVNFGSLPDTSEKTVSHGVADVDTIFISGGYVKAGTKFFGVEHSTVHPYEWTANVDETNVAIETFTDRTSLTAMVTIRYTKVTD